VIIRPDELEVGWTVRFYGSRLLDGSWIPGEVRGEVASIERRGLNRGSVVVVGARGHEVVAEGNSDDEIEVVQAGERTPG
jgi:hypothetical protein